MASGDIPDRMIAIVPNLSPYRAHSMALRAVEKARQIAPKGYLAVGEKGMASRLLPIWGEGYYGIRWVDNYAWFQENGAQPFTMDSLAGKTIPMWIKDPTGTERVRNPKAETRVREDGVTEVLIFRRAAGRGQTKTITTKYGNKKEVPASYPGAAGRIAQREARHPYTSQGKAAAAIARGNVGVRWRHPGLQGLHFMQHGIIHAANRDGVWIGQIIARHPSGVDEILGVV